MKLLFGTQNAGKLEEMKKIFKALPEIELICLKDIKVELPQIEETGNTPLENARIKATAYYKALKKPVFSCDSGLYFEKLPPALQPGVQVRTVNNRRLSDQEMTKYYSGLAKTYGDITAKFQNGICLVIDSGHIYESMAADLCSERFLLTSQAHHRRQEGFPLDCISKHFVTGEYFYDIGADQADGGAMERGMLRFFQEALTDYIKSKKLESI